MQSLDELRSPSGSKMSGELGFLLEVRRSIQTKNLACCRHETSEAFRPYLAIRSHDLGRAVLHSADEVRCSLGRLC